MANTIISLGIETLSYLVIIANTFINNNNNGIEPLILTYSM